MDSRNLERKLDHLDLRLTTLERVVEGIAGRLSPHPESTRAPLIERSDLAHTPETRPTSPGSVMPPIPDVGNQSPERGSYSAGAPDYSPPLQTDADSHEVEEQLALPVDSIEPLIPLRASTGPDHVGARAQRTVLPPKARPTASDAAALEVLIGTRWVAWAGALLVILAAGFFVKLAYDNGWLRIPPAGRCLLLTGFGVALLAAGEWTLRKINRAAATSLYAAGIGVLYLTAFASCKYFNLVSESTAFVLLAVVACLGIAVTLRGRMGIIGAISLVGGYGAPLLLQNAAGSALALPLYLTFLLVVALTLSARRPEVFRPLRALACVLHAFVAMLWLSHGMTDFGVGSLLILIGWWAFVGVELAFAAHRNQSPTNNAVTSGLATAWLVLMGCRVLNFTGHSESCGVFLLALAATITVAAFWRGRGISALQHRPGHAAEMLGVSLWLQSGALLAVAIAAQFSHGGIDELARALGWLALGLAGVELGRRLRSTGVEIYGVLVGLLALARVFVFDPQLSVLQSTVFTFSDPLCGTLTVTRWTLLGLLALAATLTAGLRTRLTSVGEPAAAPILMSGLAVGMWMFVTGNATNGLLLPVLWLAAWLGLNLTARWATRQCYAELALIPLIGAVLRWLAFDALDSRMSSSWSALTLWPVLNPQLLVAALIGAAFWQQSRIAHRAEVAANTAGRRRLAATAHEIWLIVGALFMLVAFSFEVERALSRAELAATLAYSPILARTLWLLALWACGAFAMLLIGARRGFQIMSRVGWVLLGGGSVIWLTFGTIAPRLTEGPLAVTPILNVQCLVGLALVGLLLTAIRATPRIGQAHHAIAIDAWMRSAMWTAWSLVAVLGLWLGSFELDRAILLSGRFVDPDVARQTAFSIFWGLYGIALVGCGFGRRVTALRYAGLTLLGITLAKVVLIDMSDARTLYRVLSFLALGLVLIVTSITYAKLSSRLLTPRAAQS